MNEDEFIQELLDPKTQNTAFKQLVAQYQKPLYYHIRSIVLDHEDADDVLQNTFVKVFQYLKSFKQESKLYTWMYRIATNEALSHLSTKAKKNGRTSLEHQAFVIDNLEADVYFEGDEIQIKLQKAILL
ncbi:MAG: sigma-70 family RNA polymerase sigma factor, partial [Flavobacterium sp.]|nr:sigma-70 family RNA polymerase sigma factor [Flavobacterium sp.]